MNQIRIFISLYFNLSRKEANGFVILCLLIPFFIFLPWIGRLYFSSAETNSAKDQQTMDMLLARMEDNNIRKKNASLKAPLPKKGHMPHAFDPNFASETEMIHAGVPDFIAGRIVKFRSKGGTFKTKEDLKKIYGVSENIYRQFSSSITITPLSKYEKPSSLFPREKKKPFQPFDLNKADSTTLVALKGIGPTLASRILKYRLKLGGFIDPVQLREVYGLDSTALQEIFAYGYIDKDFIPEKIDLNSPDEKALREHPYIGRKIATMIFNYRHQHGNFSTLEQLQNIKSITAPVYLKMLPYLK